jgi:hypothetical protein
MVWLKQNYRQVLVALLSAVAAAIIQLRPEWRAYVLAVAGVLGLFGLHLPPVSYGASPDPKPEEDAPKPKKEDLQ